MIEVDLNNGMFRKIDLNKPVYCVKCKKEIIRDKALIGDLWRRPGGLANNLNIDVHTCGYAFCKECKKKLNEFARKKLADYERKLVEDFIK